jgi:hypothetical protein
MIDDYNDATQPIAAGDDPTPFDESVFTAILMNLFANDDLSPIQLKKQIDDLLILFFKADADNNDALSLPEYIDLRNILATPPKSRRDIFNEMLGDIEDKESPSAVVDEAAMNAWVDA